MESCGINFWSTRILFLLLCGHYLTFAATQIDCGSAACTVNGFVTNAEFPVDGNIKNAKQVTFTYNSKFSSFPKARSTKLPNICHITAKRCGISSAEQLIKPDSIFVAENVESLVLNENHFPMVEPPFFQNLTNLQNLELSDCKIEYINETTFQDLINLKTLDLNGNLLSNIDANTFKTLSQLVKLDLHSNLLSSVNLDIFSKANKKLEDLNLTNNTLSTVNITQDNYSLQQVSLANNIIQSGDFIKFLKVLEQLSIAHNPGIQLSEDLFNSLPQLTVLYMAGIELQSIINFSKLLMGLSNLQYLDIGDNSLKKIDLENFPPLELLTILGLYENQFVTIENYGIVKEKFPDLKFIDISGNNWDCSFLQTMIENWLEKDIKTYFWNAYPDYHSRVSQIGKLDVNVNDIKCCIQNQKMENTLQNDQNTSSISNNELDGDSDRETTMPTLENDKNASLINKTCTENSELVENSRYIYNLTLGIYVFVSLFVVVVFVLLVVVSYKLSK